MTHQPQPQPSLTLGPRYLDLPAHTEGLTVFHVSYANASTGLKTLREDFTTSRDIARLMYNLGHYVD
jgi:hypothetical protein